MILRIKQLQQTCQLQCQQLQQSFMTSPIKRSQQFQYFQSKARHYDNIKKMQPAIQSFRDSPIIQKPRPHSLMRQYDQHRANQNLVNTIIQIRHKSKSRIEVEGGYSRYNNFNIDRISKYGTFKQAERYRSIDHENQTLGQKILRVRPSIGTINDWQSSFQNYRSRQKIVSRFDDSKKLTIYSRNRYVPEYMKTFLDRDGSTVAIKEKLFELPKVIAEGYLYPKKEKDLKLQLDFRQLIKDTSGELNIIQE